MGEILAFLIISCLVIATLTLFSLVAMMIGIIIMGTYKLFKYLWNDTFNGKKVREEVRDRGKDGGG